MLGDERLAYTDAEERSAQLARALLASGVGKGTRVGLLAPNGPSWIVGWLAATRIGAVVSLLNTYHRERELSWVLRHADVQVLLTVDRHLDHRYLDRLEAIAPSLLDGEAEHLALPSHPYLRSVWAWGDVDRPWAGAIDDLLGRADRIPESLLREVEAEVAPADPMVVVYSSGSTAEPKGAIHSHGATVRHAHNLLQLRDLRAGDVVYTPMPLFWVGGLSYTLVAGILTGATLVFEERFEPGATLDLIERERVTLVLGWPHMAKALTDHPGFPQRDLSSIRGGTVADLLPPDRRPAPGELHANSLGMTETLGPHTADDHRNVLPADRAGSFGRPVPGLEHRVVDPDTGEVLPVGSTGELWVRGYSLMLGLHKRERQEVFTPDGWYRTGDAGRFDDEGHFHFAGRLGDQIKTSGMNVTPLEVEAALARHPEVSMAVVTGVPHETRGEDVAAAVVLTPGAQVHGDELRDWLKQELSSYKVPRLIRTFASRDDLPWLDSGKVDVRAVKVLLGSPS